MVAQVSLTLTPRAGRTRQANPNPNPNPNLAQDALVKALQAVDADLVHQDGVALVRGWCDAGSNLKLRLTLTSDPDPNLTLATQT